MHVRDFLSVGPGAFVTADRAKEILRAASGAMARAWGKEGGWADSCSKTALVAEVMALCSCGRDLATMAVDSILASFDEGNLFCRLCVCAENLLKLIRNEGTQSDVGPRNPCIRPASLSFLHCDDVK